MEHKKVNPTVALQVFFGGGWCEHEQVDFRMEGSHQGRSQFWLRPPSLPWKLGNWNNKFFHALLNTKQESQRTWLLCISLSKDL